MPEITRILQSLERGEARAADELLPLFYEELRRLAAQKMAGEPSGQTLQATALVHEAWLRLVRTREQTWQNRAHFFRTAAECMRRILIDNARRKKQVRQAAASSAFPWRTLRLPMISIPNACSTSTMRWTGSPHRTTPRPRW